MWKAKMEQSRSPDLERVIRCCDQQVQKLPGVFQPVLNLSHSVSSIFLATVTVIQQWPGPPPGASLWKHRGGNLSEATVAYQLPQNLPHGNLTC